MNFVIKQVMKNLFRLLTTGYKIIIQNVRRAVTEGLRIWTSRPYFKDNPDEAIKRIATLKEDSSEYVRKSVGNSLRDISKKISRVN